VSDLTSIGRGVVAELAGVVARQQDAVDWASVRRLVEALDGARRVLVFGAGRSRSVALALAQRLNHVGVGAASVGESGNTRLGAEDVLLLVSGSGATASAVAMADQAAAAGVGTLVLLTSSEQSPLAERADVVCRLHARGKGSSEATLSPYTAPFDVSALVLGEAVCRMVMEKRGMEDEEIEQWRPNVE